MQEQFEKGVGEFSDSEAAPSVAISADIAASFTYASYQNAIPVVRSLVLANSGERQFENCRLELTTSPPFIRQKVWAVDRLIPGDELQITDRKVQLDADYLAGLNEAERGEIVLRLTAQGEMLDEKRISVRLLARDEWGGAEDMAQLLPAFVMPNDPGVAPILRAAAESLARHGHPTALDGYQSGDPSRAYLLAAAIHSAIAGLGLYYAEPPASFESRGQKIRRPSTIAADRLATCLDTTLLFAAALEAAGLNPVILMFQGHAAVGVWLVKRTLAHAVETDLMEVRKALALRELMVFETTGVCYRPPMTLDAAKRAVDHRLAEEAARDFVAAIDIARSRSSGITPLASHEPMRRNIAEEETLESSDLPLPSPPPLGDLPPEEVEVKPTTAAGRIDRWQKKLLDLTLRNRLLNLPDGKKTIPFLCADVAYLEDRLADGAAIRIISLPEQNPLGERDPKLFQETHGRDIERAFAAEALLRDELASRLEAKDLEARLIDLYRQVRNDFAEGGANTLFLAVGFLRWRNKKDDKRTHRAPLLLVPVRLERRSASSRFAMRYHEDEPRFNATLLQFLERDFDLTLPQFAGELPLDDSGVDVPRLLAMMRLAVRDVPGMEVVDEAALSTFSFAKYLMWKDLVERTEALRQNRVVRHLIDSPEQPFQQAEGGAVFRDERELDKAYSPVDIVCPLPSDSSQMAACIAAAEGRDFIVIGPPGTGKSQTIANMIANCLASGKTVLFVAEKTAALDVVYRRLREHGLGNHCIELHSNKADRKHFLRQLKTAWEHGRRKETADWIAINERLRLRREELNAYVEALHRRYACGWTPYQALGIALKGADRPAPAFSWTERDAHGTEEMQALENLAAQIGHIFASVRHEPALALVDVHDWSPFWQEELYTAARSFQQAIDEMLEAARAYREALDLDREMELDGLISLASAIFQGRDRDLRIAFHQEFAQCVEARDEFAQAIRDYRSASRRLSAAYDPEAVLEMDVGALARQWKEANEAFLLSAAFGKRKVQKLLQSYAGHGKANPETDLPLLKQMRSCLLTISNSPLLGKPLPARGLDTDVDEVASILDLAQELRKAVRLLNLGGEELRRVLLAVNTCLDGTSDPSHVRHTSQRLLNAADELAQAAARYAEASGVEFSAPRTSSEFKELRARLAQLEEVRPYLRDWAVWCRTRSEARERGLGGLVELVEEGSIATEETVAAFRLGYARWWFPKVLEGDAVLREFRRFQHEHAIKEFREIDDMVRSHAIDRVISAIAHDLPSVQSVPRNSELGLLRHQMELQRPSQSIRDMISRMPQNFSKLAPCMLMSPLSIAQYLPPDHRLFDVVIFDEASQITTWDAVGAIARARQTIIVGDPKQLPPTNFFGRNEEDDETVEHYEKDLESILDEARVAGIPVRDLRWHYRSRSESLIAFSNQHYYQNRLVTFPSPVVEDRAVRLRKVPHGVYDRGKSRTNRIEAEAVAAEAVSRMRSWLQLPEKQRPTLGIITLNAQQQSLILDLLDVARREEPDLEWFFAEERVEPTIVKNLENVQGDERDVILFSITFWKDAAGKLSMSFGALNGNGGQRRLNVAITRARQELIVFSGFTADQIDLSRTRAEGVRDLKTFLDYAERGPVALAAQDTGSLGGFDSPFEEAVAEELQRRGWQVVPQVGISGFRIDLGVRHPDLPGAYLAGIECDGASYHSSATARDRDKVREQVLRGLGWNILRVWSTDWWFDSTGSAARLHAELEALLEASLRHRAEFQQPDVTHWDLGLEVEGIPEIRNAELGLPSDDPAPSLKAAIEELGGSDTVVRTFMAEAPRALQTPGAGSSDTPQRRYEITDLSGIPANPDEFFEIRYRNTLQRMVDLIIETESPLRKDVLAQRIARAHGWLRTGGRIRERIELHLRNLDVTKESSGEFVWKRGSVTPILPYRPPASQESRRAIADIPLAELASIVVSEPALLDMHDPPRDLARLLGVERLAAVSRARLEEAIERAKEHIEAGDR